MVFLAGVIGYVFVLKIDEKWISLQVCKFVAA